MPWLKFSLIEYPPHDLRTGKPPAPNTEAKYIKPGGRRYPEVPSGLRIISWQQKNPVLMLLVEGDATDVDKLKNQSGSRSVRLSKQKTLKYNLSNFTPAELTDTKALDALKEEIGLPEGTTLDTDKKPVIPKEKDGENTFSNPG